MTNEAPLLIRADATRAMGTGHAMRCFALAQAWQDAGGTCLFAMAEATPAVQQRIKAENFEVVPLAVEPGSNTDASQFVALARERSGNRVVVDGYQFGADYQRCLKSAELKTLFIDDYGHAEHYSADWVLNQNVSATENLYTSREPHTKLLLGPQFALLRREFNAWREFTREIPPVGRKVLITLGGSDPQNVTASVLESLAGLNVDHIEAMVVVGGSNPHFEYLKQSAVELENRRGLKITVSRDIVNMAQQISCVDVAISAAGTTCWELCLLSVPALLMDVAENQTEVARELHRRQCAIHVGCGSEISPPRLGRELEKLLRSKPMRETLSVNARQLVDGEGTRRIVSVLRGIDGIHLRPAKMDDRRLLFDWANDPHVRRAAFSGDPITWESHVAWFSKKLHAGECSTWIAEDWDGFPLGQIRFDVKEDGESEIDISIDPRRRGLGLAPALITLGLEEFFNRVCSKAVHALVKETNGASIRSFEKAGFRRAGITGSHGAAAIDFIYERN